MLPAMPILRNLLATASIALILAPALHAQDRTEQLLQRLSDAPGPPGAEEPVRAIMVPEMKQFATKPITYDGVGSVIAQQGDKGPRIMINAGSSSARKVRFTA